MSLSATIQLSVFVLSGTFTGSIVRLISGIHLKHGRDAVALSNCGRFVLAEDLSDIADMTHIDLSGINSLEGASFSSLFAVPLKSLLFFITPLRRPRRTLGPRETHERRPLPLQYHR